MKTKGLTLYPLVVLLLSGCATVHEKDGELARLNTRVTELKRGLDETNARLEDLGNKFMLLHEKLEATRAEVKRQSGVPATPPEGLSVVELGPEALAGAKGAEKIESPAGPSPAPGRTEKPAPKAAKAPKASASPVKKPEAKASGKGAGPEALYNAGQDLFMAGDFVRAREVFKRLADTYPAHTLADNALYWLGESYYSEQDYQSAVLVFQVVVEKYPSENKAPDALLKVAFSYIELDELGKAREALNTLFDRYPDTEAARRGKKRLSELEG